MPVIIRAPGVHTSNGSKFEVTKPKSEKRKYSQAQTINGSSSENDAIAYEGSLDPQRYCLAIKDPQSGEVKLVDAPLFDVTTFVKSKRESDMETAIRQSGVRNWQQRTALGEAFGTKKAKTAISDVARNRLDAGMLEGLEDAIMDTVRDQTASLPSTEERQKVAETNRTIPPYNSETEKVSEIYPLEGIVPESELALLGPIVDGIVSASSTEAAIELLPFKDSDFVNARLGFVLGEHSNIKPRVRLLVYLSFLRAVFANLRATSKQTLMERVGSNVAPGLYDGVIQRFTVAKTGNFGRSRDRGFAFDPFHISKLLSYMLALTLHIDNFAVDITPLAHELSTKVSKLVSLFRNLGCSIKTPNMTEARERELSKNEASVYRMAVLSAPLKLPDVVKRKRA